MCPCGRPRSERFPKTWPRKALPQQPDLTARHPRRRCPESWVRCICGIGMTDLESCLETCRGAHNTPGSHTCSSGSSTLRTRSPHHRCNHSPWPSRLKARFRARGLPRPDDHELPLPSLRASAQVHLWRQTSPRARKPSAPRPGRQVGTARGLAASCPQAGKLLQRQHLGKTPRRQPCPELRRPARALRCTTNGPWVSWAECL
mmetsp:Transcript_109616/g.274590  ORF Transcript_109616/g.274590 Transcript_109616/m.274590 type:complete len:203 (+) Transcript_109616:132-740(+)